MAEQVDIYADIRDTARRALIRIRQVRAPLTPESYRLWFEYCLGTNPKLVTELNSRISTHEAFSKELTDQLYERFFLEELDQKAMRQVHDQMCQVLSAILQNIMRSSGVVETFGGKLDDYAEKLSTSSDFHEIRTIAEEMACDTSQMAESSRSLQKELVEVTKRSMELQGKLEKAESESLIDPLTTLNNRRAFDRKYANLYREYKRDRVPFSVFVVDIDFFKRFNDEFGHLVGDEVLRLVGALLQLSLKGQDFPSRYGGEEFFILLPGTSLKNALIVAEDIRKRICEKRFKLTSSGKPVGQLSVSIGVAEIRSSDMPEELLNRADNALYLAKDSGRNCVKSQFDLDARKK